MRRLGLEAGEELALIDNGRVITLVPQKYIPKDQRWYHADTWQRMMQEAFEDVRGGRVRGPFESAEELIRDLRS